MPRAVSTLMLVFLALQPPQPAPQKPFGMPLQFVVGSPALRSHASVKENALTIRAGAKAPYVSSINAGEFEAEGEVAMPEEADANLLVYVSVDLRWHVTNQTKIPLPRDLGPNWKQVRVSSAGGHLVASIAGAVVGKADVPAGAYGRIGFDVARGKLSVRNWRVLRLDAAGTPRVLIALNPDLGLTEASAGEVTEPTLLQEVKPRYTRAAMESHIEGDVELEAIVERDGSVGEIRILRPLFPDLDRSAADAVRQWRFEPPRFHGSPVRQRVSVILSFVLK